MKRDSNGNLVLENSDIQELRKIFSSFSESVDKLASIHGYVGDLGTTPMFSQEKADMDADISDAEKEYDQISKRLEFLQQENDLYDKLSDKYDELYDKDNERNDISNQILDAQRALNDAIMNGDDIAEQRARNELARLDEKAAKLDAEKEKLEGERKELEKIRDIIDEIKGEGHTIDSLEEDRMSKMIEIKTLRAEEHKLTQAINKELAYQNKKLEEGVRLTERMNHYLDQRVMNTARFTNGISEIKKGFTEILGIVKDINKPWGDLDQQAADYAKHIGLSQRQFERMRGDILRFATSNNIEGKYNVNAKELIQLQERYNATIGRRTDMTKDELETMAAMKTMVGDEAANQFTTSLENFGLNPDEVGERVGEMFKEANKEGVSFEKYSKNFLNNIKLAQNYTFERGLHSLKEMAKRSTEIKLDMQQVARFADKVSTLEGAMKAGAQLSVLGGSFNQFSDPLRMLYYGLNDIQGLEKNLEGMFGNMAKFNKDTGQLEVSAFNRQRIRAAAEATGMDYTGLMESIFAQGRRKVIEPTVRGKGWSEEQKNAVLNLAQLDEKGNAYVNLNGVKRDVSTLTQEDVNVLTKTSIKDSDNIKTITQTLLGYNEKMEAIQKARDDQMARLSEITGIGNFIKGTLGVIEGYAATLAVINFGVRSIQALLATGGMLNGGYNAMTSFGKKGAVQMSPNPAMPRGGAVGGRINVGGGSRGYAVNAANVAAARGGGQFRQFRAAYNASRYRGGSGRIGAFGNAMRASGMGMGVGMLASVGAGIGGDMLRSNASQHMDRGDFSGAVRNRYVGGSILEGAGMGAGMGMMFGPWGALAGAVIGGAIGGFKASSNFKDQKYRNEILKKSGGALALKGDYTNEELRLISQGGKRYILSNNALADKIYEQEGLTTLDIPPFKEGGVVNGVGTETSDSNLALLSKNEYIVPADKVKVPENFKILESMRDGGRLVPHFIEDGSAIVDIHNGNNTSQTFDSTSNTISNVSITNRNQHIDQTTKPTPRYKNGGLNIQNVNSNITSSFNENVGSNYNIPTFRRGFNNPVTKTVVTGQIPINQRFMENPFIPTFRQSDVVNNITVTPRGNEMNITHVDQPFNAVGVNREDIGPSRVDISPINVTGTIKLDLGAYSKEIDAKKLLDNPLFIEKITNEVMKKFNVKTHMSYDKNSHYKKF